MSIQWTKKQITSRMIQEVTAGLKVDKGNRYLNFQRIPAYTFTPIIGPHVIEASNVFP